MSRRSRSHHQSEQDNQPRKNAPPDIMASGHIGSIVSSHVDMMRNLYPKISTRPS